MFIARENELNELRSLANHQRFEFLVMFGRRRVGKTELLRQLSKEYDTLFYSAQIKNAPINLSDFSDKITEHFHLGTGLSFASWEKAFEFISNNQKERLIVIIDEFPFLANGNPTILSTLQHIIDHNWKNKNLFLILCGSAVSFMEKEVLSAKSPLYGRRTAMMEVKPFDYYDASLFTPNLDDETKAIVYGAFGGIPKYLELYDPSLSLKDNLLQNILKTTSYLFEEPDFLLRTELRETAVYNSILEAMAMGNAKINDISSQIHEENTKTVKYISVLNQLRIVQREVPATEDIHKSKKSIYSFKDNFFRFWYSFVFPHKQEIELLGAELTYSYVENGLSSYMGLIFEKMCQDYLLRCIRSRKIDFIPEHMGKWWGANPYRKDEKGRPKQDDIDILMYNKECCLLGECKFTNEKFRYEDYTALVEISQMFKQERKSYYLFSKRGFDQRILKEAEMDTRIVLVELKDLYQV